MTTNQINWFNALTNRAKQIQDYYLGSSTLRETGRHNMAVEEETARSNRANESTKALANAINQSQVQENIRANQAREAENHRTNVANEAINSQRAYASLLSSSAAMRNAATNEGQLANSEYLAGITSASNVLNAAHIDRQNRLIAQQEKESAARTEYYKAQAEMGVGAKAWSDIISPAIQLGRLVGTLIK